MSRRQLSPQEKKELSYKKDKRVAAENPHGFRKNFPKKKAFATRAYRHKIAQELHTIAAEATSEEDETRIIEVLAVRRRQVKKSGVLSLRDNIRHKLDNRAQARLISYFRSPYNSQTHRQSFTNFLEAEMQAGTLFAQELAFYIDDLFIPTSQRPMRKYELPDEYKQWFKAYLADNREIEPRLREWSSHTVGTAKKKTL